MQFKELGFLPHALLNYLVRLGWSAGDKEIFSVEEMISLFDLKHVSRGVSSFNYEKLNWLNQHYQKSDSPRDVATALNWHFVQHGVDPKQGPDLELLVQIQAERCKTLAEIYEKSLYFYNDEIVYDEDAVKKHLRPVVLAPLTALTARLQEVSNWTNDILQECLNGVSEEFDMNLGKIAQPLRVAVTGGSMSPSIDMTLAMLGKEKVLKRLQQALLRVQQRSEGG